jgi:ribosome small subunit-dependent GTPase A
LNLEDLGWNSFFESHFTAHQNENLISARVSFQARGIYRLISATGEFQAEIGGALRHDSLESGDLPVCGDWVLADNPIGRDRTVIRFLLPRRTSFSRKQAGTAIGRQVIAANIDTVCLVSGLDSDFNPRRIERYLAIAWESGARPVIVLNKADICPDVPMRVAEANSLAPGIPVLTVSATEDHGMESILSYAGRGQTIAFLGSSGVGKSSSVNRLLGQSAQLVRESIVGIKCLWSGNRTVQNVFDNSAAQISCCTRYHQHTCSLFFVDANTHAASALLSVKNQNVFKGVALSVSTPEALTENLSVLAYDFMSCVWLFSVLHLRGVPIPCDQRFYPRNVFGNICSTGRFSLILTTFRSYNSRVPAERGNLCKTMQIFNIL